MRIVFLVTRYPHETHPADGVFHRTAAEALARAGCEVEVVAPVTWIPPGLSWFSETARRRRGIPANRVESNVRVHRPRYLRVFRAGPSRGMGRAFAAAAGRTVEELPDIVHAHAAYPCGLASLRLKRRWKVPVVLTLHGSDVNVFPGLSRSARTLFVEAVRGADRVVAVSEALASRTEELSGVRPRVLPVGIDLAAHANPPDKAAARDSLGLPPDRRIVLFVGSLLGSKGIGHLLEAMQRLADPELLAVFLGEGPWKAEIERSPYAHAAGLRTNHEVTRYMAAADVLVLPSEREGMPTVLIEAGAVGLPVVATRVGGIPELLDGGRGILIEPGSAEEIAHGIRRTIEDPIAARQRAARLKRYVSEHYDVDRSARVLIELYREAAAPEPRSRGFVSLRPPSPNPVTAEGGERG